jgi:hypothetical protein
MKEKIKVLKKFKFKIFFKGKPKILYWFLISNENWIIKIEEENWNFHFIKNFVNIVAQKIPNKEKKTWLIQKKSIIK